jgi:hypothetical protein
MLSSFERVFLVSNNVFCVYGAKLQRKRLPLVFLKVILTLLKSFVLKPQRKAKMSAEKT